MNQTVAQLYGLLDPLALCVYLGKALNGSPTNCDNTFLHTRAFLTEYAPDSSADEVLRLLGELGAGCDCEVGLNACPEIEAAEDEEDQTARYFPENQPSPQR